MCASAVGFYGASRPEPVGEDADRGEGFLADVVADWEDDCAVASEAGVRVVNIRTGLVLGGGAPLLTLLAASSRVGGGRLGSGEQHFPWIGVDDLADIYHRAVVDPSLVGPVNAVAPEDITEGSSLPCWPMLRRCGCRCASRCRQWGPRCCWVRTGPRSWRWLTSMRGLWCLSLWGTGSASLLRGTWWPTSWGSGVLTPNDTGLARSVPA